MPIVGSVMGIQVIGNSGENIIKSPIVEAYIGSSLLDSTEVASDTPTDISTKVEQLMAAKHSHDNKAILDKFAEANGKPTYNGIAIGGGGTGGASTAEEVSYTNTQLPNVANVKTALDELVPNSHTHSNKGTLDKLSDSNGKLQYNGSDVGLKGEKGVDGITPTIGANGNWYLGSTDTGKPSRGEKGDKGDPGKNGSDASVTAANVETALGYTPQPAVTEYSYSTAQVSVTLADNAEYRMTGLQTLTVQYPEDAKFESWMRLTFAESGNITVTLPVGTKYIGAAPDFKNGETWELSFKDKVLAAQKVGKGTAGADGYIPVKGVDYWTAADKQEIVEAVLAALPDGTEVAY